MMDLRKEMSKQATIAKGKAGIELKGGMVTLFTIPLTNSNLPNLSQELDDKINQAPNFFHFAPIILDLQALRQAESIDLPAVMATLKEKKLVPVGVRGANKALKEAAIAAGLALFPDVKTVLPRTDIIPPVSPPEEVLGSPTRLITQPVRSGQQIYVPRGDLIILGAVSSGAEVLADGHIHIYGPLRGRALAGVMGDKGALIFCKSLEAELVSVAGKYRASEDLKETHWKKSVIIQLQEGRLNIFSV